MRNLLVRAGVTGTDLVALAVGTMATMGAIRATTNLDWYRGQATKWDGLSQDPNRQFAQQEEEDRKDLIGIALVCGSYLAGRVVYARHTQRA